MVNKLFKSIFAVATILGSALGFVACEDKGEDVVGNPTVEVSATTLNFTNQEGSQTVDVTSNAEWKVENGADWVTVTPAAGKGDATITIAVAMNDTGAIREAVIKVHAQHPTYGNFDTKKITVSQSATEEPTVEEVLLYGDNFDGQEATKTYGSGSSWPYIDQFPEFANPEGPASENVTYTGSGVSVRANSTSNSNYSDYAGSGSNNIFFGANAYFQINGISLDASQASYKLTFGSEKYSQDGDSIFKNSEFHVMLSMDGYGWSEIEYTYAGTEGGRWNVATAEFTLTEVPENLYIKFNANVASVYRLDDVKLFVGNGGQQVTLTPGEAPEPSEEGSIAAAIEAADGTSVKVNEATVIAIYNRGFLMEDATGKLLVYTNATATVKIGTKVSVEGTVTTYGGFKQFAAVKDSSDVYGPAPEVTVISEGSFTQPTPEKLDGAAMDAYLLSPAIKYVEYTGVLTISGSYYNVTVPGAQTAVGSISYPIAGTVDAADGQEIVVRGYTIGVSSSKYVNTMLVECTAQGEAPEIEVKKVTIAEFLAAAEDNTWYELTGVIGEVKAADFGNFYMSDETGTTYVYGLYDEAGNRVFTSLGLKSGDTITLRGRRTSYKEEPQVGSAIYISHVAGEGGETPEPPVAEGIYASDAAFVCATDDSANAVYGLGETTINGNAATGFKLGTGKKSGYFKSSAVGVDGDKYINMYAVAWKGKSATLYFRVDGGATQSLTLAANDGATSNPPYDALKFSDSDHYSVKLTGLKSTSTIEFSTDASFSAVTNETSGRAIVCGVKLTDEPLGNQGGGTTPEPEPSVVKATVAEFLAAAEDSTIYELTGEITRMYREDNPNDTLYGNFYLKDATGEVLIYGLMDKDGNKYWEASGVKIGDTITVQTIRTSFSGTPQGKNATYISHTPGSGETPEPEPTPGDVVTIASVLALGEGATINGTIEATVVSNYELNNLTSKKGMYVQDETGALQFYLGANHEFAFGTKVKIDLTGATLGSYNGAVQVSGLALDKITVVSNGNTVTAKTVSIADFLANKYEGQYIAIDGVQVADAELSKTWVMDGKHTSIAIEDATGNKFVVFSSKYATYGAETVAQGSGTLKGISSINNGNLQIIFAQASDYAGLTGNRFGDAGGEEPEPENPVAPEGYAGRDDFNTIDSNSSYTARKSTAGWVGENCAVQSGGANDSNPVFNSLLGADENTRAWVINGKTSAIGKITSPVISTGCGTLTFNYGIAFTEKNGYDFNVEIVQNGAVVKSFNVVNADNTKYAKFTFSEEVNVAGDFQIVITNNCPSANSESNKDRYSIWDIMWTAHN